MKMTENRYCIGQIKLLSLHNKNYCWNKKMSRRGLLCLLLCLLTLPMRGQEAELLIDLPDVDSAILATELIQTESMSQACRVLELAGVQLADSCNGTAHYTYLVPNRIVCFTLTRQRHSPRLRSISFSAPVVERLLPETMLRLGYRIVRRKEGHAEYRHKRLGIEATLDYDPASCTCSMDFRLIDNNKTSKL